MPSTATHVFPCYCGPKTGHSEKNARLRCHSELFDRRVRSIFTGHRSAPATSIRRREPHRSSRSELEMKPTTDHRHGTLRKLRGWTLVFLFGLVASGATAIPLETELRWIAHRLGVESAGNTASPRPVSSLVGWFNRVHQAVAETNARHPFMAYGTDWLAFGHFVIAIAFTGLWRDPVRNRWLIDFGLIACGLVLPYAFVMGGIRGIPVPWRIIDCSFGLLGAVPLLYCRRLVNELETGSFRQGGEAA